MGKGYNIKGQIRSFRKGFLDNYHLIIQLVAGYDKKPRFPVPAAFLTYLILFLIS